MLVPSELIVPPKTIWLFVMLNRMRLQAMTPITEPLGSVMSVKETVPATVEPSISRWRMSVPLSGTAMPLAMTPPRTPVEIGGQTGVGVRVGVFVVVKVAVNVGVIVGVEVQISGPTKHGVA